MSLDFFKFRGSLLKWDLDFSEAYSQSVFQNFPIHVAFWELDNVRMKGMRETMIFAMVL